jgi:hypothetical protein
MPRPQEPPKVATGAVSVGIHPTLAADAAKARVAVRLCTEYFLRTAQLLTEHAGGDLLTAVILRAIVAGNIGYLDDDLEKSSVYGSLENVPPDDLRRPISVLAVSRSLSLPFETTRRHVKKLIGAGLCIKVKGGIVAPSSTMRGPREDQAVLANMANLRRLFRALKRAGVMFD